ncbi:MAG: hypothetical protein A2079_05690 [Geobacteraceae bacterium GWC2_48_7]|nr:MAG: hypothetical protein A2079_05690 [Geobacteraceae bacterium GWC2_48_7]
MAGLLIVAVPFSGMAASFGVARTYAPVLNKPDFKAVFGGKDRISLKTDNCGQVRELEFTALPGTVFKLLEAVRRNGETIYRVETDEYIAPPGVKLFLDSRFLEITKQVPPSRSRRLPGREEIVASMRNAVGVPYVWGGNRQEGIDELSRLYYQKPLPSGTEGVLLLAGVDCSGLLYQATNGWTPRNTSQLVHYGKGLSIAGKTAEEIARLLEPLDLIVWKGHVVIVLDPETTIESALACGKPGNGGVVTTALVKRIREVMKKRQPADDWPAAGKMSDVFVIRRWIK